MAENNKGEITKPADIDWQQHLDHHFPNLGKVYISKDKMQEVNAKLTRRNRDIEITRASYNATFYDHFIQVIDTVGGNDRRKKVAWGLLSLLEAKLSEFSVLTDNDPVLFRQLKDQMEGLFWDNQAKYLDRVGELLSTVQLIKAFAPARPSSLKHHYIHKNGMIDNKGKDADLLLIRPDGQKVLIDILNVNLDHDRITDREGLRIVLTHRIEKKWKEKKFDEPLLHARYEQILIQPFIWIYDQGAIEQYRDLLADFVMPEALPLLMMQQGADPTGKIIYQCLPLGR